MRLTAWAIATLALLLGTVLICRELWYHPALQHAPARETVILEHLEQGGEALILGDSLVERNAVRTLCGRQVINAGIGRATTADLIPLARKIARDRPELVVLAVGVNGDFDREAYRTLFDILRPEIVVGVTGEDRSANAFIRSLPARYVEPLPPGLLPDGVHYGTKGAGVWRDRLEAACHAATVIRQVAPSATASARGINATFGY